MRSTLEEGLQYGRYNTTYNIIDVLEEIQDYLFFYDFWYNQTRPHFATSWCPMEDVIMAIQPYKQKLKLSILIFEVLGFSFEPSHSHTIWDDFYWIA